MSMKNYYYIDASVFLEEDFYQIAERLWQNIPNICFLLDESIDREIARYHSLGQAEEALTLAAFAGLLKSLAGTVVVNTAGGFDASALYAFTQTFSQQRRQS